ncbi:MAG: 4Fe-4S ferredoxin [Firmicutes bacterium]|nr:4Fe-4S ferredoxin [Bacillota bacterium]
MKSISKDRLSKVLERWASQAIVYTPVKKERVTQFAPWTPDSELEFSHNTLLPPKNVLFPQTEKMYAFNEQKGQVAVEEIKADERPRLLFGVRPCDLKAISELDQVFLTKGFVDKFYADKRKTLVTFSLGCRQPLPTCFCTSLGVNPIEAEGADVVVYDLGGSFGFAVKNPAAQSWLDSVADLLDDTDAPKPRAGQFTTEVDLTGVTEKLQQMFNHPIWAEIASKCLNCGICTYLCPTCHCFDIQGKVVGERGYKFRCWDSCMFPEYTQMAGGHNPRPTKVERVRQRFSHKLRYFPERYGMYQCTGCGRCLRQCPMGIDIVSIINTVREVAVNV